MICLDFDVILPCLCVKSVLYAVLKCYFCIFVVNMCGLKVEESLGGFLVFIAIRLIPVRCLTQCLQCEISP